MKSASAVLKDGQVFIQAYAETTAGVWIAFGPVFICDLKKANEMASNVRAALALSTHGVPHPGRDDWQQIQKPMLDAVGAKSWTLLAKRAKAVGLECEGEIVRMTPSSGYQNEGGSDLPEQAITSGVDAEDLGQNLIKAFDISS